MVSPRGGGRTRSSSAPSSTGTHLTVGEFRFRNSPARIFNNVNMTVTRKQGFMNIFMTKEVATFVYSGCRNPQLPIQGPITQGGKFIVEVPVMSADNASFVDFNDVNPEFIRFTFDSRLEANALIAQFS